MEMLCFVLFYFVLLAIVIGQPRLHHVQINVVVSSAQPIHVCFYGQFDV
jgi:hypothetical protein